MERALDLGVKHVMVWYRIGEDFQRHVARRSRDELMDEMLSSVRAARRGTTVNLFLPESTAPIWNTSPPPRRQRSERAQAPSPSWTARAWRSPRPCATW
ncbi:MAG: hypothetical protein R2873_24790 [Caldilineaceae bacterium]